MWSKLQLLFVFIHLLPPFLNAESANGNVAKMKIKSKESASGFEVPFENDPDFDAKAEAPIRVGSVGSKAPLNALPENLVIFASENKGPASIAPGKVIFSQPTGHPQPVVIAKANNVVNKQSSGKSNGQAPPPQGTIIARNNPQQQVMNQPLKNQIIYKADQPALPVGKVIFDPKNTASSDFESPFLAEDESNDFNDSNLSMHPSAPPVALPKVIFNASLPVQSSVEVASVQAPTKPKKIKYLDEAVLQNIDFDPTYEGPKIDSQTTISISFVEDTLIPFFKSGGLLDRKSAYSLFYRAFLEFNVEDTLEDLWLEENQKLIVFGDIHGQFFDFLQVLEKEGFPRPELKYLFNGDIVDRGAYSVECLLTLLALKVAEPDHVFVSLGNHETMTVGKLQFYKESSKKYGNDEFFRLAHQLFKSFPVSFLLEDEVFITHGGLSPFLRLDRIRNIDRLSPSYEDSDIINDLTWSDPVERYGVTASHRGLGYLFGPDITKDFIQTNNVSVIIRSHQYKETGFSEQHDNLCITVFSCPNYRGTLKNLGAYLKIDKNLDMEVKNFVAASTLTGTESPILPDAKLNRNLRRDKSKPLDIPVEKL